MKKKIATLLVAMTLTLSSLLSACQWSGNMFAVTWHLGTKDVFEINGNSCSIAKAKVILCNYQNIYGKAYGLDLWSHDFGEDSLESYVKEVTITELARIVCMADIAEQSGIQLTEEELTAVDQATDTYYESLTKEELSYMGVKKKGIHELYEEYALAKKLYATLTEGVNDEVSEDEARVLDIMQIYVTDESVANMISASLEAGSDFSSLAAEYNELSSIEINVARGDLPEAVEEAAYSLDDNEIAVKIAAGDGWYFLKCISKNVKDLTAVNKETIAQNREQAAFDDEYQTYVEKADSYMNEKAWDNIELDVSGNVSTDSFFKVYQEYFEG